MSARERILDGAAEVMRSRGLANTTTKEIARAAGLSEAMLYKVFRDKVELFLAVLTERLPKITVVQGGPGALAGRGSVAAGLRRLVAEVVAFYLESFPIAASVFSDPALLTRHHAAVTERGAGPDKVAAAVAGHLAAEQRLGRVASTVRPDVLAELLVGACLHRAFLVRFAGGTQTPTENRSFAAAVVAAIEPALAGSQPTGPDRSPA